MRVLRLALVAIVVATITVAALPRSTAAASSHQPSQQLVRRDETQQQQQPQQQQILDLSATNAWVVPHAALDSIVVSTVITTSLEACLDACDTEAQSCRSVNYRALSDTSNSNRECSLLASNITLASLQRGENVGTHAQRKAEAYSCPNGTYINHAGSCRATSTCQPTQYERFPAAAIADRVCASCEQGYTGLVASTECTEAIHISFDMIASPSSPSSANASANANTSLLTPANTADVIAATIIDLSNRINASSPTLLMWRSATINGDTATVSFYVAYTEQADALRRVVVDQAFAFTDTANNITLTAVAASFVAVDPNDTGNGDGDGDGSGGRALSLTLWLVIGAVLLAVVIALATVLHCRARARLRLNEDSVEKQYFYGDPHQQSQQLHEQHEHMNPHDPAVTKKKQQRQKQKQKQKQQQQQQKPRRQDKRSSSGSVVADLMELQYPPTVRGTRKQRRASKQQQAYNEEMVSHLHTWKKLSLTPALPMDETGKTKNPIYDELSIRSCAMSTASSRAPTVMSASSTRTSRAATPNPQTHALEAPDAYETLDDIRPQQQELEQGEQAQHEQAQAQRQDQEQVQAKQEQEEAQPEPHVRTYEEPVYDRARSASSSSNATQGIPSRNTSTRQQRRQQRGSGGDDGYDRAENIIAPEALAAVREEAQEDEEEDRGDSGEDGPYYSNIKVTDADVEVLDDAEGGIPAGTTEPKPSAAAVDGDGDGPYYSNIAEAAAPDDDHDDDDDDDDDDNGRYTKMLDEGDVANNVGGRARNDKEEQAEEPEEEEDPYDNTVSHYHNLDDLGNTKYHDFELDETKTTATSFSADALEDVNTNITALLTQANAFDLRLDPTQFVFRGVVGEGDFGTLAKAKLVPRDGNDERSVMTLVFLTDDFAHKGTVLLELALKLKEIDCNYVVDCLGIALQQPKLMVALEFAMGDTLQSYFAQDDRNDEQTLIYFQDMLLGLQFCHKRDVLHTDLRSAHVWLCKGQAKLFDFGFGRRLSVKDDNLSLRWMAPEVSVERKYTKQGDVYSAGMVLYESALGGELPFSDKMWTAKEIMQHVRNGFRAPKPRGLAQSLYDMCLSCWSEDPACRPSIAQMLSDIQLSLQHAREQAEALAAKRGTSMRASTRLSPASAASVRRRDQQQHHQKHAHAQRAGNASTAASTSTSASPLSGLSREAPRARSRKATNTLAAMAGRLSRSASNAASLAHQDSQKSIASDGTDEWAHIAKTGSLAPGNRQASNVSQVSGFSDVNYSSAMASRSNSYYTMMGDVNVPQRQSAISLGGRSDQFRAGKEQHQQMQMEQQMQQQQAQQQQAQQQQAQSEREYVQEQQQPVKRRESGYVLSTNWNTNTTAPAMAGYLPMQGAGMTMSGHPDAPPATAADSARKTSAPSPTAPAAATALLQQTAVGAPPQRKRTGSPLSAVAGADDGDAAQNVGTLDRSFSVNPRLSMKRTPGAEESPYEEGCMAPTAVNVVNLPRAVQVQTHEYEDMGEQMHSRTPTPPQVTDATTAENDAPPPLVQRDSDIILGPSILRKQGMFNSPANDTPDASRKATLRNDGGQDALTSSGEQEQLDEIYHNMATRTVPEGQAPVLVEAVGNDSDDEDTPRPQGLSDNNYLTPRAYLEPEWLHGVLSRKEAEVLIKSKLQGGGVPGCYFVRRRAESDHFVITVMTDWSTVEHFLLTYDPQAGWYLNNDVSAACGDPSDNLVFVLEKLREKRGRWRLPLNAPVTCFKRRDEMAQPVAETRVARGSDMRASQQFQRNATARRSTLL